MNKRARVKKSYYEYHGDPYETELSTRLRRSDAMYFPGVIKGSADEPVIPFQEICLSYLTA